MTISRPNTHCEEEFKTELYMTKEMGACRKAEQETRMAAGLRGAGRGEAAVRRKQWAAL